MNKIHAMNTATLINFAFLAHAVLTTNDVVKAMK
jgi:hypothetical protein